MFMTVSARMADLQQVLQQDDQLHPAASPDNDEVGLNCQRQEVPLSPLLYFWGAT